MSTRPRAGRRLLAAGIAAASLAGCAALRIDVDVYKGPLANHEDIQVRQYAALAVAASPVLATLRNRLEDRASPDFSLLLDPAARYDWIPGDRGFRSDIARFINGALSFYHDTGDPVVTAAMGDALRAHARFRATYFRYAYDKQLDARLAGEIENALPRTSSRPRDPDLEKIQILIAEFGQSQADFLRSGIRDGVQLVAPPLRTTSRDEKKLQEACRNLRDKVREVSNRHGSLAAKLTPGIAKLPCAGGISANEAFGLMAQRPVMEAYSRVVFGRVKADYIDRMTEISYQFMAARRAMRDLWLAQVSLIETIVKNGERDASLVAAARGLSAITQSRSLACYFTSRLDSRQANAQLVQKGVDEVRLKYLRAMLGDGRGAAFFAQNVTWTPEVYKAAEDLLEKAATKFPLELVALLRYSDHRFKDASNTELGTCTGLDAEGRNRIEPVEAREFGLARGPGVDADFNDRIEIVSTSLNNIAEGSAAGFERARPAKGIDSLTQEFLASLSANGNDPRKPGVVAARKRLEESLILWAERVLAVVNNRALLPPAAESQSGAEQQAREVAVLEAVGNNILLHADDTRRRDDYDRRQRERAAPEARAIQQAFDLTAAQTLDNLLRNLRLEIDRLAKEGAPAAAALQGQKPAAEVKGQLDAKKLAREKTEQSASEILAALATVASPVPTNLTRTDPQALDDTNAVALDVGTLAAEKTPAEVLDAILKAIDAAYKLATINTAGAASPRGKRLEAAKKFFEDKKPVLANLRGAEPKPAPNAYLTVLRNKLLDDVKEELSYLAALRKDESALSQQHQRLVKQESAATSAPKYVAARDILIGIRGEVLTLADQRGADTPRALLALLAETVRAKASEIKDNEANAADRRQAHALALKVVQETTPPRAPALAEAKSDDRRTQKDLTDDLAALLRNQRTQALAAGEAPRAAGIDNAIKRLFEDRADMAYLRPASVYLRNVYAATSLQTSPDVSWVNMLARNTKQAFGGGGGDAYQKEYLETLRQIDKQHWQTINSVTLAGGGSTNYVLAKDDVGNWYVKTYSADPESIFRSAQGLALFGIGKGLDTNLLRRAQLQRQLDSGNTLESAKPGIRDELKAENANSSAAGGAALSRVYLRYREAYESRTRDDVENLRDDIAKLDASLVKAWSQLSGTTKDAMVEMLKKTYASSLSAIAEAQTSHDALDKALKAGDATGADRKSPQDVATERARAILQSLESMRRLRQRLELYIQSDKDLLAPYEKVATDAAAAQADLANATANRSLAAKAAATYLTEFILQKSGRRLDTVKQFETALTIVRQAAVGP